MFLQLLILLAVMLIAPYAMPHVAVTLAATFMLLVTITLYDKRKKRAV